MSFLRAEPDNKVSGLFGNSFNEKLMESVKSAIIESGGVFKGVRVVTHYDNGKINFSFESAKKGKPLTARQLESIKEKFDPILKQAIKTLTSEL